MIALALLAACARPAPPPPAPAAAPVDELGTPQAWAAYTEARALWAQGELDAAQQRLERALFFDDEDPTLLLALGELALAQGDAPRAAATLERALAAGARPRAHGLYAEAVARAGDRERALALLQSWESRGIEAPEALWTGAGALRALGHDERALEVQAVALSAGYAEPGGLSPFARAAWAHERVELGRAALAAGAGGLEGLQARAWLALESGDAGEALVVLPALQALAPEDPLRAELDLWLSQPPAALALAADLSRAVRRCAFTAGLVLDRAQPLALTACGATPVELALLRRALGSAGPAAASGSGPGSDVVSTPGATAGRPASESDPGLGVTPASSSPSPGSAEPSPAPAAGQGSLLRALALPDAEALPLLEAALAEAPRPALALSLWGEALARLDRCAEALPLLAAAAPERPGRLDAWLALSRCAEDQGHPELVAYAQARAARLPYGPLPPPPRSP